MMRHDWINWFFGDSVACDCEKHCELKLKLKLNEFELIADGFEMPMKPIRLKCWKDQIAETNICMEPRQMKHSLVHATHSHSASDVVNLFMHMNEHPFPPPPQWMNKLFSFHKNFSFSINDCCVQTRVMRLIVLVSVDGVELNV